MYRIQKSTPLYIEQKAITSYVVGGRDVVLSATQATCSCRGFHCEHMAALLSELGYDSVADYQQTRLIGQKNPATSRSVSGRRVAID